MFPVLLPMCLILIPALYFVVYIVHNLILDPDFKIFSSNRFANSRKSTSYVEQATCKETCMRGFGPNFL